MTNLAPPESLKTDTGTSRLTPRAVYTSLSFQVLVAMVLAVIFGFLSPAKAVAMKPLGDLFIRMITSVITLVIFCTVSSGIAGMHDMKKVGRVGGKALLYFETVSSLALLLGLFVGNVVRPGSGFNIDPATLDARNVADYAGQAKAQSLTDFLLHIVPSTFVDAFAKGDILQVVFIAVLFGFALSIAREHCKALIGLLQALTQAIFGVVNIMMYFAPIGAFGAMAFTVGKYGITSLGPLTKLIITFYLTCFFFLFVVLGTIARVAGFNVFKLFVYLKEELLLVLATSSSEPALPTLMSKLQELGCSQSLVGLVVPTGYTFNADGTSLYMTMAALFVAQATNTPVTLGQQLTILALALLTSKGASGVQGAAFVALVGTLMVIQTIPVAGMAIILGIDRFMSMFRALVNMSGNAVATLVIARWEGEIDPATLKRNLDRSSTDLGKSLPQESS
jgi:aerobic C4-dicarboxylate transport protein